MRCKMLCSKDFAASIVAQPSSYSAANASVRFCNAFSRCSACSFRLALSHGLQRSTGAVSALSASSACCIAPESSLLSLSRSRITSLYNRKRSLVALYSSPFATSKLLEYCSLSALVSRLISQRSDTRPSRSILRAA